MQTLKSRPRPSVRERDPAEKKRFAERSQPERPRHHRRKEHGECRAVRAAEAAQEVQRLKQQISSLTVATEEARNAAGTADFRQKSVEQQLELAQKNNEWLENELKVKKTPESPEDAQGKGARITGFSVLRRGCQLQD